MELDFLRGGGRGVLRSSLSSGVILHKVMPDLCKGPWTLSLAPSQSPHGILSVEECLE
jgi:hypothetical protein